MNKKIQVAKYYDKVNTHYKEIDYENDIKWIRENVPELMLWSDLQIIEMGYDDYGQTQEQRTFQTPLNINMFKDYALAMALYELNPDDILTYYCEEELLGIYNAYNKNESLNKWNQLFAKNTAKLVCSCII